MINATADIVTSEFHIFDGGLGGVVEEVAILVAGWRDKPFSERRLIIKIHCRQREVFFNIIKEVSIHARFIDAMRKCLDKGKAHI